MDEVLGAANFVSLITVQKTTSASGNTIATVADYLIWYARDINKLKFRPLFLGRAGEGWVNYDYVKLADGTYRRMTAEERSDWSTLPRGAQVYRRDNLTSQRPAQAGDLKSFNFEGRDYRPGKGTFKSDLRGLERLREAGRLEAYGETLSYRRFANDFPYRPLSNLWTDTLTGGFAEERFYVVQTVTKIVQRCLLMATDPGDLVLDITCGSGTTAVVAEQWGRRWITCDTSRVALTLAKQRLMTSVFDYYQLARPEEGVDSGFRYKSVPHVTLKSITSNEPATSEMLYDQPIPDTGKTRVAGPFTVEAVPAPTVRSIADLDEQPMVEVADQSIARSGATLRQNEWTSELLRTGVRGKGGQRIEFARLEALAGTRYLNADAETKGDKPQRVVVSFGPEHAPLEQRQVSLALEEAQRLVPKPKMVLFAAFQFDPEASKDIDETNWPGVTMLKVQMNADLLTEDLKKKRSSNESFWLIGQPDVVLRQIKRGEERDKWEVEVNGFDYYNTKTGQIESGGAAQIAAWFLDTDYDGRSLFPRQVFFPMAGESEGWAKLARNLKAEIDEDAIEAYRGTISLAFSLGKHKRVAVKIVDDRGIESLKVVSVE